MNRKTILFVILSSLILGSIGGWLFIRFFIPKLNEIAFLRKYNLTPKTSPLIINTREEIRVNEGSDSIAAIQHARPWIVGVVAGADAQHAQLQGAGVILTSDGLIAAPKTALPNAALGSAAQFTVSDGTILKASVIAIDPSSNLALFKADTRNLPTAGLGFPKDLQLGQRMIVLSPSLGQYQSSGNVTYLSSELRNLGISQVYSADQINRTFALNNPGNILEGSAIFSLDSNLQGLYSKNGIVTADTIKSALNSYFNSSRIVRISAGLFYQPITKPVSVMFNIPEGVRISKPDSKTPAIIAGSAAEKAGLAEGDLIYQINGTQITFDNSFEELLNNFASGQTVHLSVRRGNDDLKIDLTLGSK